MPRRRLKRISKRKFNKKVILILVSVLILSSIIFALYLLFFSNYFNIKILDVKSEKTPCVSNQDLKEKSQLLGQNFFTASEVEAKRRLLTRYICVKNLTLIKYFPDKAQLVVSGREPVAILVGIKTEATSSALLETKADISTESGVLDKEASPSALLDFSKIKPVVSYLIDDEGVIFSSHIENISAPKLYLEAEGMELGKKINADLIRNFLHILDKLRTFAVGVQEARIYSQKVLVFNSNPKLIFSLDKPTSVQLASLQLILEKAKIEETEMDFVDLRFDKPVVKFAPKKKGEKSGS